MKKKSEKKLTLGKIKIASLSDQQQMIRMGGNNNQSAICATNGMKTNEIRCVALTACACPPSKAQCIQF